MKKFFNHLFKIASVLFDLLADMFNHLFIRLALPDAVAPHNEELVFRLQVVGVCIRESSNWLLLRSQVFILFIFEITKRPGKIQITVNTTLLDNAACFMNSLFFLFIFRFVVETERHSFSSSAQHGSRVSRICHNKSFQIINHDNVGSAPDRIESLLSRVFSLTTILFVQRFSQDFEQGAFVSRELLLDFC